MDRLAVTDRINKILPVAAAVPTAGVLGSPFGGSSDNNQV